MSVILLRTAVKVWLVETLVSGFNFFVLMSLVYEPRWGPVLSNQIGMTMRIIYIFGFTFLLLRYVKTYSRPDLLHVGILWLGLELLFEWGGSLATGRPVSEILIGWNVFAGYLWPFVLLAYTFANLIVGMMLHPGMVGRPR